MSAFASSSVSFFAICSRPVIHGELPLSNITSQIEKLRNDVISFLGASHQSSKSAVFISLLKGRSRACKFPCIVFLWHQPFFSHVFIFEGTFLFSNLFLSKGSSRLYIALEFNVPVIIINFDNLLKTRLVSTSLCDSATTTEFNFLN